MSDERKVLLQEFTRPAFEEYLASEPNPVALIPLGSIEQHGPHLPLGTDSYIAQAVAERAAQRTNSIVITPCWPGYSPHHMGFPGTITFSAETLTGIIIDTVQSLADHGIKKVVLVNAHGGNRTIAADAARAARRRTGSIVLAPSPTGERDPVETLHQLDVHAGAGETGAALALFPELVEMERVEDFSPTAEFAEQVERLRDPDGPDPEIRLQLVMAYIGDTHEFTSSGVYGFVDPKDADPEEGQRSLDERLEQLVKLIQYWKEIDLP